MKTIKRRSNGAAFAVCAMVLLAVCLSQPEHVRAQWTTPDAQGNINNTNTGKVGIGTTAPAAVLHVATESTASPRGIIDAQHSADNNGAMFRFWKARGTIASPAAAVNGDNIGNLYAEAYDGASYVSGGRIRFSIDGTVSSGVVPTGFQFFTGSNGSGTERMRITSSGNVGIGTAAPAYNLDVQGGFFHAAYNTQSLPVSSPFGGLAVGWNRTNGGAEVNFYNVFDNPATAFQFSQKTGASTAAHLFTIKGNGNVGIGTAAPSSKLHLVSGTDTYTALLNLDTGVHGGTSMAVYGTVNNESGFDLSVYRAGQYFSRFGVSNTGNVYLQSGGGSVGIGTTSPTTMLDVAGQIRSSTGGYKFPDGTVQTTAATGGSSQWTPSGSNIYYGTGNVGVGTISGPAGRLDVRQISNSAALATLLTSYGATEDTYLRGGSSSAVVHIGDVTSTTSKLLLMENGGNVGIGTSSPTSPLFIAGNEPSTDYATLRIKPTVTHGGIVIDSANNTSQAHLRFFKTGVPKWQIRVPFQDGVEDFRLFSFTTATDVLNITPAGNVGIGTGTTTPSTKLHVAGDITVTGTGNISATGTINAKYQDVAEWVESSQALAAGTVVVLDHTRSNQVIASSQAYDTRVAGVISLQPGIALGESGAGKVLVATTGRVKIKVDASAGAILIGDLLVTSDREGIAKKSEPLSLGGVAIHRPGTLIGKALEPLAKGTGEILVLLSLQ